MRQHLLVFSSVSTIGSSTRLTTSSMSGKNPTFILKQEFRCMKSTSFSYSRTYTYPTPETYQPYTGPDLQLLVRAEAEDLPGGSGESSQFSEKYYKRVTLIHHLPSYVQILIPTTTTKNHYH